MALLAARDVLPLPPLYAYAFRTVAVALVLVAVSRPAIRLRPARAIGSAGVGILVFAIWIMPDLLAPAWRQHWLFANAVVGRAASSVAPAARSDAVFLISRVAGAALLVPIVEELFWRGFLMRWLAGHPFWSVPPGKYTRFSFWATAILFASEHGPYWDVGLLAGIAYNWWMLRTRSLADCILAHAVTNACLAAYVLASGRWEYWL